MNNRQTDIPGFMPVEQQKELATRAFIDACLAPGPDAFAARTAFEASGIPQRESRFGSYTALPEYHVSEGKITRRSSGQIEINLTAFGGLSLDCGVRTRGLLADEFEAAIGPFLDSSKMTATDAPPPSDFEIDDGFDMLRTMRWSDDTPLIISIQEISGGGFRFTDIRAATVDPMRGQVRPDLIRDAEANVEITF